ncbi:MAG: 2'-5' RNA ligase family protein, partial [Caldimonas sp.]
MTYPETGGPGELQMQEDRARLFTALWPDPALRARWSAARDAWCWPAGAKPVDDARLHLTLHFIGAFPRGRIAVLESALAALAIAPMHCTPLGPELWRGGIAVLRVAGGPELVDLHGAIGAVLPGLGVALDPRPFAPHVTLARRARGAVPPAAI